MPSKGLSRRDLLKIGAAAGAAELAATLLPGCGAPKTVTPGTACSTLTAIEHVVIFIQENRSFDHYFGSYRGVRGFSDQSAAFRQPDPANTASSPSGVLLPFHLDTFRTNSACTHDIAHDWVALHQSWNGGAMDGLLLLACRSMPAMPCSAWAITLARTFPFTMPWRMLSPYATTTSAR